MTNAIIPIILDYVECVELLSEDVLYRRGNLHAFLISYFPLALSVPILSSTAMPAMTWIKVPVRRQFSFGGSHSRMVYKSNELYLGTRWVAKLDTYKTRKGKLIPFLHAEEIAFKMSSLLGWNTAPKTITLHESAKHPVMDFFLKENVAEGAPVTFTFQACIEGDVLPCRDELRIKTKPSHVSLTSYQQAFLLAMIIGKKDAKGDNTMINPTTGEIHEIDNESFSPIYPDDGILHIFDDLKNKSISGDVLRAICNVTYDHLNSLQREYMPKDTALQTFHKAEPDFVVPEDLGESLNPWKILEGNLRFIQEAIGFLSNRSSSITLADLEARVTPLQKEVVEKVLDKRVENFINECSSKRALNLEGVQSAVNQ